MITLNLSDSLNGIKPVWVPAPPSFRKSVRQTSKLTWNYRAAVMGCMPGTGAVYR